MEEFYKLKQIDNALDELRKNISFLAINPSNLDSELAKVTEDENYDPQFKYKKYPFDLDEMIDSLKRIPSHDSFLGTVFDDSRNEAILKCKMLANRGMPEFTSFASEIYGTPSFSLIKKAKEHLIAPVDKAPKILSSWKTVGKIKAEVTHYGFDYEVDHIDMSASAAVLVSQKKIFVRKGAKFSEKFVKRLLVHEVGTHVLRAENGRLQPFKIFISGFPNYLLTEEGLAVYNEERFGLLDKKLFSNFAGRTLAVNMAMTKSFSSVYKELLDYFKPKIAARLALRAKRGIGDSSNKGGCSKDYVYLDGYYKVKSFIEKGGNLRDLYFGKISLDHVKKMKSVPGIVHPLFLPKKQFFKDLMKF